MEARDWSKERTRATTTFGIGRDEYYRSKKPNAELGPGSYPLKGSIEKKPFYMGQRIPKFIHDDQPNCATYTVSR